VHNDNLKTATNQKSKIMLRKGKIARLPRPLRHELNRRLADNEDGGVLLNWLNALPEVKAVLARDFAGEPISKQNLYEWRQGGFLEWQARQDLLEHMRDFAADAEELDAATNGRLLDGMATAVAVRYATTIANWDGTDNEAIRGQLRILRSFSQDIIALRRSHQGAVRLKIDQIPFDREEKKLADAVVQAKIDKENREQIQSYLEEKWRLLKLAEAQAAAAVPVAATPAIAVTAAPAAARYPADQNVPLARAV
jgi:hypothetical protein